jgi:TPR repeat protein
MKTLAPSVRFVLAQGCYDSCLPCSPSYLVLQRKRWFSTKPTMLTASSFAKLKASADGGDSVSQCLLAYYYRTGTETAALVDGEYNVEKDLDLAFRYYESAAKAGNATAQNNLGICFKLGEVGSVKVDLPQAFHWFKQAALQNHPAGDEN